MTPMMGLALVVSAITGALLIKALVGVLRGRGLWMGIDDVAWYVFALAVVTNFFGLLPSNLSSVNTAIARITEALHGYYGIINAVTWAETAISISTNLGLPIAETAAEVLAGVELGPVVVVVDVVEHVVSAVIQYLVNFISILTEALLFIKFAMMVGEALGPFIPYLAALLVIPRVRAVAAVPVVVYLVLGIALPLGVNMALTHPIVEVVNTPRLAFPNGLGFANVEVVDELGRPLPAVLHILSPGLGYSETVGLPGGLGLVPLPIYEEPRFVGQYVVDYVVALFMRFPVNAYLTPSPEPPTRPVMIKLPLIAVFNGDSLVALFNYTWMGDGFVNTTVGGGYAVIEVTTPCNGNLTIMAYAGDAYISTDRASNCSITYSVNKQEPNNLVSQAWLNEVLLNHEFLCQSVESLIIPSPTYAPEAPPQVLRLLLNTLNESCSGIGYYNESMRELRSIELSISLKCLGRCNNTHVTVVVIGVKPYSLNYYALWGGTYVAWLNQSMIIIRNADGLIGPGPVIAMFTDIAYTVALVLGLAGLVAITPRIREWGRLMSAVRVRLSINYGDVVSTVGPSIVRSVAGRVGDGLIARYKLLRVVRDFVARRWYARHLVRAGYWAIRELPNVSVAPHVVLPLLYGASMARSYLLRRVRSIEDGALRSALRLFVVRVVGPSMVLRPYSALGATHRFSAALISGYFGNAIKEVSQTYSAIKHYVGHHLALYIALRSLIHGLGGGVARAIQRVYSALDDPIKALLVINAELGIMRGVDAEMASLIARDALGGLITRHPELVNARVLVNNVELGSQAVLGLDDYVDVVVRVGGRDVVLKAWVVKELARVVEGRRFRR